MALSNTLTNGKTSAVWYFPKDVCNRFYLNHQTIEGLRITGIFIYQVIQATYVKGTVQAWLGNWGNSSCATIS